MKTYFKARRTDVSLPVTLPTQPSNRDGASEETFLILSLKRPTFWAWEGTMNEMMLLLVLLLWCCSAALPLGLREEKKKG